MELFLNQHGVDTCLLSETPLKPEQAFRLANYVCHRAESRTTVDGTAILVSRGVAHHPVHVPDLSPFEATDIQVTMTGKMVKVLAAYLPPSRPLIGAEPTACKAANCRSRWPAASTPNTWIGTRG
jgi:hypothetical protein